MKFAALAGPLAAVVADPDQGDRREAESVGQVAGGEDRMTEHRLVFRFVYGLLAVVAVVGVSAFFGYIVLSATTDTNVQYVEKHDPPLTGKSTVAQVEGRFDGRADQSVPGTQIGLQGGTCDVYIVADGGVLVCHA